MYNLYIRKIATHSIGTAVLVGIGISGFIALAWTEPGVVPTASQPDAPIHVGGGVQNKQGALGIISTDPGTPALVLNSNLLIQDGGHLRWGVSSGPTEYGFRSNAGVMQFKNSSGAWNTWTNIGTGNSTAFYGYTNFSSWNPCNLPSVSALGMQCEVVGTVAQAQTAGWTKEDGTPHDYLYKAVPGQTTSSWSICTLNGIATPYSADGTPGATYHLVVKKPAPDTKWYVYLHTDPQIYLAPMNFAVSCWR